MKKKLLLIAMAAILVVGFSSCKKMRCHCTATGPANTEEILDKHYHDCVNIAENGLVIEDSGVTVTCEIDDDLWSSK